MSEATSTPERPPAAASGQLAHDLGRFDPRQGAEAPTAGETPEIVHHLPAPEYWRLRS